MKKERAIKRLIYVLGLCLLMLLAGCGDKSYEYKLKNYTIQIPSEFCNTEGKNDKVPLFLDNNQFFYTKDGEAGILIFEETIRSLSAKGYVKYIESDIKEELGSGLLDYNCEKLDGASYDTYKITYMQSVDGHVGYVKVYVLECENECFMLYATFSDKVSGKKIEKYTKKIEKAIKNIERSSDYVVPEGGYTFEGDGFSVDIPNDMYRTSDQTVNDLCRICYRSVDSMELISTAITIQKEDNPSYKELAEQKYKNASENDLFFDVKISETSFNGFDAMLVERNYGDEDFYLIDNSYYIQAGDNVYSVTCSYDKTIEDTEQAVIQSIINTIDFN